MPGWFCILETTTVDVRKSPGFCVACQDASMLCDTGIVCCGVSFILPRLSVLMSDDGERELWDKSR